MSFFAAILQNNIRDSRFGIRCCSVGRWVSRANLSRATESRGDYCTRSSCRRRGSPANSIASNRLKPITHTAVMVTVCRPGNRRAPPSGQYARTREYRRTIYALVRRRTAAYHIRVISFFSFCIVYIIIVAQRRRYYIINTSNPISRRGRNRKVERICPAATTTGLSETAVSDI